MFGSSPNLLSTTETVIDHRNKSVLVQKLPSASSFLLHFPFKNCRDQSQMRSSSAATRQELHIKQDDKFFSKLLSKEASTANPSFRVYYGDVSGAVPFTWETQPGTPKHALLSDSSSLPPLTLPPAYYDSRVSKGPNQIRSSNFFSLRTLLMRIITTTMNKKKKKKNSHRVMLSPPSCSSSSLSSLSWSSSSHSTTTAVMMTSSSSSSFAENQDNVNPGGSWTSSCCFGLGKASNGSVKLHQVDNSTTTTIVKKTLFSNS